MNYFWIIVIISILGIVMSILLLLERNKNKKLIIKMNKQIEICINQANYIKFLEREKDNAE